MYNFKDVVQHYYFLYLWCVFFFMFMIILFEINVKGFVWKCAKKTSIYGQNHKVASSGRYWTLLTKEKLSGVICNLKNYNFCHILHDMSTRTFYFFKKILNIL